MGEVRNISWEVADTCGPLTYQVEISHERGDFEVLGVTEALLFNGTFFYTAPIQIVQAVPAQGISLGSLKASFLP